MAKDSEDDADFLEQLRDASIETQVQQLRFIHELKRQGRDDARYASEPALRASPTPSAPSYPSGPAYPGVRTDGGPKTDGADLLFDLARLSLNNYEQWLKLNSRHFDYVLDSLRRLSGRGERRAPAQLTLTTSGRRGAQAVARFVIENPLSTTATVAFSTVTLRCVADGKRVPADIRFERVSAPSLEPGVGFDLAAGQSGGFQGTITIEDSWQPGAYLGEAYVLVGGRVIGQMCIEVDVQ